MKNILLSLMFVFLFTGCFNNKPKKVFWIMMNGFMLNTV